MDPAAPHPTRADARRVADSSRDSHCPTPAQGSPDSVSGADSPPGAGPRAARRARARFFFLQNASLCACGARVYSLLPFRDLTNPHTSLTTARGQWPRACAPIGRPAGVLAGASPVPSCSLHRTRANQERRGSPKRSPHPPARPASPSLPCFLQSEGRRLAPLAKGGRSGSLALFACMAAAECALLLHTHTQAHTRARTTMRAHTHLGLI